MFAISSGHTKTIPLCNQMEHIISESLRMENSLSHFFFSPFFGVITAVKAWKMCVHDRGLIWDVFELSVGISFLFGVERFGSEVLPRWIISFSGKYSICL